MKDRYRFLGVFPLLFLVWCGVDYYRENRFSDILWVCNISNGVMALGLFLNWVSWVWTATICLGFGLVAWVIDGWTVNGFELRNYFSHIGALIIGTYYLTRHLKLSTDHRWRWWRALVYFIALRVFCRFFTPPELNVNLAFQRHPTHSTWVTNPFFFHLGEIVILSASFITTEFIIKKGLTRKK